MHLLASLSGYKRTYDGSNPIWQFFVPCMFQKSSANNWIYVCISHFILRWPESPQVTICKLFNIFFHSHLLPRCLIVRWGLFPPSYLYLIFSCLLRLHSMNHDVSFVSSIYPPFLVPSSQWKVLSKQKTKTKPLKPEIKQTKHPSPS